MVFEHVTNISAALTLGWVSLGLLKVITLTARTSNLVLVQIDELHVSFPIHFISDAPGINFLNREQQL